ncbi:MAG: hypothetical protein ACRC3J_01910 [Culicoidibacterales bacterium]
MIEIFGWVDSIANRDCLNVKILCDTHYLEYKYYAISHGSESPSESLHRTMLMQRLEANDQRFEMLPAVFISGKYIGGYNELRAHLYACGTLRT